MNTIKSLSTIFISLSSLGLSANNGEIPLQVYFDRAVIPVLAGEDYNPTGYLQIIKSYSERTRLTELSFNLNGTTDLRDIERLSLYECDKKGKINKDKLIAVSDISNKQGTFRINFPLKSDTVYIGFAVKLRKETLLSNRINVNCNQIKTDKESILIKNHFDEGFRVGLALRKHKQDGVNTSRIPGITTSKSGTLLAIYDARWDSGRDLQGDIDIALNRSEDGGQTWQPLQRILDQHEWGGLPEKYNGVSDACILVDEKTGDLYVAGLWMHGVLDGQTGKWIENLTQDSTRWIHQWHAKGSQPGLKVKETSQFLINVSSTNCKCLSIW